MKIVDWNRTVSFDSNLKSNGQIFAEELSVDPEHGLEFLGKIVTK